MAAEGVVDVKHPINRRARSGERPLELPDAFESLVYIRFSIEGNSQNEIAREFMRSQSTISRAIRNCRAKIGALIKSKTFTSDEIEQLMRRLIKDVPEKRRVA